MSTPLRAETFQLNYTKAAELVLMLRGGAQVGGTSLPILSKRGSVVSDPRTNTLFVQDIPSRLEAVRRIIASTDIPVRQVMIEARIVEANDKFGRSLGVRLGTHWFNTSRLFGGPNRYTVGGQLQDVADHSGQPASPSTIPGSLSVNLPAATTLAGEQVGAFSVVLLNSAATKFLNLELTALESDGKGKIISSPRVVTANQIEALIEQGTEIPYQQATSSGATSIAFRKAVLALRVKPQITPDGNVIMDVDVNKDSRGTDTLAGPSIDTKHVRTSVLVENGGTVVIGGIYTQEDTSQVNKIPFFGDLPWVGPLFRNYYRTDNKTELLVFLTPRIIDDRLSVR